MKRRTFIKNTVAALPVISAAGSLAFEAAGALEPIVLPKPEIDAALSLGAALKNRRTSRAIGVEPLPLQTLANLNLTRYVVGHGQPDPHIGEAEVQKSYYFADTGFIAQNVYLFAAAQGLAAWFHNCDKQGAAREFKLRPARRVLFAQTVGFPTKD